MMHTCRPRFSTRHRVVVMLGLVAVWMAAAKGSWAQASTARAAEFDEQARRAFAERNFAEAARRFRDAYDVVPHPATKYNEAMAWERAGDLVRAADAYQLTLSLSGLDAERVNAARERLQDLERGLAVLIVPGPEGATVSVQHAREVPVPARLHLVPGTQEVLVRRRDGVRVVRKIEAKAGKVLELVLEVSDRPAQPPTPKASHAAAAEPAPAPPPSGSQSTWGWIALGGAGACSAAAGYLGLKTMSTLDDYEASGYRDANARDRAESFKLWTNVAWSAAAVTGVVGVVLLLSDDGDAGVAVERNGGAQVRLTTQGVAVGYTF